MIGRSLTTKSRKRLAQWRNVHGRCRANSWSKWQRSWTCRCFCDFNSRFHFLYFLQTRPQIEWKKTKKNCCDFSLFQATEPAMLPCSGSSLNQRAGFPPPPPPSLCFDSKFSDSWARGTTSTHPNVPWSKIRIWTSPYFFFSNPLLRGRFPQFQVSGYAGHVECCWLTGHAQSTRLTLRIFSHRSLPRSFKRCLWPGVKWSSDKVKTR